MDFTQLKLEMMLRGFDYTLVRLRNSRITQKEHTFKHTTLEITVRLVLLDQNEKYIRSCIHFFINNSIRTKRNFPYVLEAVDVAIRKANGS